MGHRREEALGEESLHPRDPGPGLLFLRRLSTNTGRWVAWKREGRVAQGKDKGKGRAGHPAFPVEISCIPLPPHSNFPTRLTPEALAHSPSFLPLPAAPETLMRQIAASACRACN